MFNCLQRTHVAIHLFTDGHSGVLFHFLKKNLKGWGGGMGRKGIQL